MGFGLFNIITFDLLLLMLKDYIIFFENSIQSKVTGWRKCLTRRATTEEKDNLRVEGLAVAGHPFTTFNSLPYILISHHHISICIVYFFFFSFFFLLNFL